MLAMTIPWTLSASTASADIGAILTGVFADPAINAAGKASSTAIPASSGPNRRRGATIVYSGVMTFVIFMIIKVILAEVDAEEEAWP